MDDLPAKSWRVENGALICDDTCASTRYGICTCGLVEYLHHSRAWYMQRGRGPFVRHVRAVLRIAEHHWREFGRIADMRECQHGVSLFEACGECDAFGDADDPLSG